MAVYDKNGKVIKSAVDYGWEVTSSDVPKALDMWVEYVGEDNALEDIARAMDDDTLIENIEWIAQQWGIGEEVEEERSAWDKYEKAKELMGVHELFTNLTQAAGYDELAEDLAYIFRMNDFRQWDDMEVYSSRKPIKSSITSGLKITNITVYPKWTHETDKGTIYVGANINGKDFVFPMMPCWSYTPQGVDCDECLVTRLNNGWGGYADYDRNAERIHHVAKGGGSHSYALNIGSDVLKSAPKENQKDFGFTGQYYSTKNVPRAFKSKLMELYDNGSLEPEFLEAIGLGTITSSKKIVKSGIEIYKGAKFKNPNGSVIEIVRKDDDGYVLFKTYDGRIRDTTEESAKRMLQFNQYTPIESSKKIVKSSKEEKVNPNDPHMKFKTLDPEHKMDLREDIEDELEALLKKLHVKFDLETWNETVDYILSFFEEDNFYNPKNAKQAVHEWYLDTKDEFPDMFDSKKTKIASSAYREFIHNKMSIKSTHNLIKSSVEEEDPVEVLLKDAAQQLGATYKEGWWGKGIQEGNGRWNGSKWAVVVDKNGYNDWPQIHFIAAKGDSTEMSGGVTPMNAKAGPSEPFPKDVVAWIQDKINESEADRGSFEDEVKRFQSVDAKEIDYIESNPSARTVYVKLNIDNADKANDLAEWINGQVGNEDGHFQVYDYWETAEDSYEDLDPEIRDNQVIIFYLG